MANKSTVVARPGLLYGPSFGAWLTLLFSEKKGKLGRSHLTMRRTIWLMGYYRTISDFKFGQYIHRVHPNKSPLKFKNFGEMGAWANFSGTPYYLGNG